MYPRIDGNEGETRIVDLLGQQVSELTTDGKSFETALSSVCTYRYGGRFAKFKAKVRELVKHQILLPLG